MEFPCHLHGVSMQFSSCQSLCFADAGTCKEPPWNLHGTSMETPSKLHSSTKWHRRAEQKRKHVEIAFVGNYIKPPSKLHGTSMETPSKLHSSTRWHRRAEQKRKHVEIAFVGNYIKPPSKLHGISMESAWVRPLEPAREERQKPTSKLHGTYINSHENDYESFAKTILEAISSFLP